MLPLTAREQLAGERCASVILVGHVTSFILLWYVCIIHEFHLGADKVKSVWTDTGEEAQSWLGLKSSRASNNKAEFLWFVSLRHFLKQD